jgi:hypothetical protein
MMGSYDSDRTKVRWTKVLSRPAAIGTVALCAMLLAAAQVRAQTLPATAPATPAVTPAIVIPPGGPNVRLQVRVFDGVAEVTRDSRVRVYPAGRRGTPIQLTLGPDRAYEADVPVGLYDVQAVRMQSGSVAGVRWVERMLIQKYPDEYGRHLQVINLRDGFGALQIRPDGAEAGPAGWSAVATPPGVPTTELGKARALGPDLLLVVPAGSYDIKVVLPGAQPAWLTGIDIPDARTRLKTWPFK